MKLVTRYGLLALMPLILAGCVKQSNVGAKPPEDTTSSNNTSSSALGTADPKAGGTKPTPSPLAHKPKTMPAPPINPEIYKVRPADAPGWKPGDLSLSNLGSKMDASIKSMKNVLGHADTIFEVNGASLMAKADIKIQDSTIYSVEFYDARTSEHLNRIMSNGPKRLVYFDSKWQDTTQGAKEQPLTKEEIDQWPKCFTKTMFRQFIDGRPVWFPLFSELEKGTGGFSATVVSQKVKVVDKEREIYRVVVKRKSDGAAMEITVDGLNYWPLTIRSNFENNKIFWTCQWSVGGTFTDKDFVLPRPATS